MAFQLPSLPYAFDALEPSIDAKTMEIHHGKHHAAYVAKLNDAVQGTELENMSLNDLIEIMEAGILIIPYSGLLCLLMEAVLLKVTWLQLLTQNLDLLMLSRVNSQMRPLPGSVQDGHGYVLMQMRNSVFAPHLIRIIL